MHVMVSIPLVTGRKLNVHEMFRRRPRRLLNILCTFNLCNVSKKTSLLQKLILITKQ